jgi:hypothetical protein
MAAPSYSLGAAGPNWARRSATPSASIATLFPRNRETHYRCARER